MAYIFNADIYCDDCGEAICERLDSEGKKPADVDDQRSYDSGDYPKSVSDDDESDCPQHCGHCHTPFHNALTDDGVKYVLEAIRTSLREGREARNAVHTGYPREETDYYKGSRACAVVRDWAEDLSNYSLDDKDMALVQRYLSWTAR